MTLDLEPVLTEPSNSGDWMVRHSTLTGHDDMFFSVSFNPDGNIIASVCRIKQ